MSPKVSVIIPTYNRAQWLPAAIESVLTQTFKDFELIVVDDASTDQTPTVLQPLREHITYIRHERNLGPGASRNTGIARSSGPFLAFLDSDDLWLPEKLEAQICFFDANPEAVACQTDEIWIRKGKRVNPKKIHLKPSGYMFDQSLRLCLISPSSVMIKRWVLDEVGWFDEELPACEDYDLWLRLTSRWPVYLIEKQLVIKHGGHPDQLSARYWGMDRFRICSIVKIIASESLSQDQRDTAIEELERKCKIYASGCLKRGKEEEAAFFFSLPQLARKHAREALSNPFLRKF